MKNLTKKTVFLIALSMARFIQAFSFLIKISCWRRERKGPQFYPLLIKLLHQMEKNVRKHVLRVAVQRVT